MTTSQENFAVDLTDQTKSHDEWLAVVRFGLGTLLQNQNVLAEILVNEAVREASKIPTHKAADEIAKILRELGLTLACPNRPSSAARRHKMKQSTKKKREPGSQQRVVRALPVATFKCVEHPWHGGCGNWATHGVEGLGPRVCLDHAPAHYVQLAVAP